MKERQNKDGRAERHFTISFLCRPFAIIQRFVHECLCACVATAPAPSTLHWSLVTTEHLSLLLHPPNGYNNNALMFHFEFRTNPLFLSLCRSREKRRISDLVLETRVLELTRENSILKAELFAIKEKFGISQTQVGVSLYRTTDQLPNGDLSNALSNTCQCP